MAVGATGRLSPSYTIQDGVVPRTRLPHIIRRTAEIGQKHNIRIVNVAHAGDGNIHPILLFDERDREEVERAVAAGREILEECIASGGSITAEHGIGVEKIGLMDRLFAPADLEAMRRVRRAFDPTGRFNPGKLIPEGARDEGRGTRDDGTEDLDDALTKLNRVIDYPAADMTITVEAGMTIAELNRLLAEQRQWLPVDVPWPDRATVGGAIATNAAGPRRYAYGTMRDYLLGFTAVDGTGMTFSGGGRVVKNAAGYNMCRLMAGSLGTLGVITQATLMVRPLPEAAALLACEVPDFDLAEKLLAGLVRSPVAARGGRTVGRPLHEGNPLFGPVSEGNVGRLYVGFEGRPPKWNGCSAGSARSGPPGHDFARADAQPGHRSALALDFRVPRRRADRRASKQDDRDDRRAVEDRPRLRDPRPRRRRRDSRKRHHEQ